MMASLPPDCSNDSDALLFEMYKKELVKHLRHKMNSDMIRTLERLKVGGIGTSDIAMCKLRLESFLHSIVSGEDVHTVELSENGVHMVEFSETSLCDLTSRIESIFGSIFSKEVISGIVGVLASRSSKMPSMIDENEKLVVDLLNFLVQSSCINLEGSKVITPPLKRKDVGNSSSPAAPVKRISKKFNHIQDPRNIDAKMLFPEVEVIAAPARDGKEPIKEIQIDSDLVVLNEVTLNDKLNKMCNASEALHNKHNVTGSKVEQGRTTLRNEHSPSVSIVSDDGGHADVGGVSIPESSKFPLSPLEKLVYNAVCSLANSKHATHTVADIGGCILRYFSLGDSMAPGKEVCTFVVNALCQKYFLDERPTSSKKHYFFSSISEVFLSEAADYSSVQRSFSGAASVLPLPSCDSLFFPVLFRKHWFLFVVDLKTKFFMFLDSRYSKQDEFSAYTRKRLKEGFCRAWGTFVGADTRFNEFRTGYAHVPKQQNEVDCGIFLIKFMELWWHGCKMVEHFSQEDIPSIRAQICFDLVYCKHNTADINAVKNFINLGAGRV